MNGALLVEIDGVGKDVAVGDGGVLTGAAPAECQMSGKADG
jgi:hypothetical protein